MNSIYDSQLSAANCLLPTADCQLLTANCLLPNVFFQHFTGFSACADIHLRMDGLID